MFETDRFKQELEKVVISELSGTGVSEYRPRIVTYLQNLAAANESDLMATEVKKAVGERRGVRDALRSARELIKAAAVLASNEKRSVLELDDVQKAYSAKFCKVWPFCKS